MNRIYYITYSSIPSSLPSSLQIIKTCENLSKNKYKVTLIKPGTGTDKVSIKRYYGIDSVNFLEKKMLFDLIIVCVNHNEFHQINFYELLNKNGVFIDVKNKIKNMKSEFSL